MKSFVVNSKFFIKAFFFTFSDNSNFLGTGSEKIRWGGIVDRFFMSFYIVDVFFGHKLILQQKARKILTFCSTLIGSRVASLSYDRATRNY